VRVLELGFGTGLNTLLTRLEARHHPGTHFHYLTYEPQPVPVAVVGNLNYAKQLGEDAGALSELHECPWNECQALDPNFSFTKLKAEFSAPSPTPPADLLYFDAFAPEDQPELWTVETLRLASDRLRPGGRLLTYCAKGQFKRNLRALGYRVEALPGPPGKREITRAIRCPFGSFGHRMSVKMS
jgi:tRNA U34 5-methylaminomethyl-2-thiouridine-forming methyltransferase MnmC